MTGRQEESRGRGERSQQGRLQLIKPRSQGSQGRSSFVRKLGALDIRTRCLRHGGWVSAPPGGVCWRPGLRAVETRVLPLVPWAPAPLPGTQLSCDQAPNLPKQPGKEDCDRSLFTHGTLRSGSERLGRCPESHSFQMMEPDFTPQLSCSKAP